MTIFLGILSHLVNGIFVFSVLGILAHTVESKQAMIAGGPGPYWESYSGGMAMMPNPTLASITMFFIISVFNF